MSGYRRYKRPPRQSTKALTMKLALLAVIATLVVGGLIAAQMAAGNDPALGPKAVAKAKKASRSSSSQSASTGTPASPDSGTDPYTQAYGYNPYSSGSSAGSSSSGSGYSTQRSSPAPVTSGTS
jgi:hypothetical protein